MLRQQSPSRIILLAFQVFLMTSQLIGDSDSSPAALSLLDCTLRDGGYYNAWDFPSDLINEYLLAMKAVQVDVAEVGFRFLNNKGFKGPCAYTTDDFLRSLDIPSGLVLAVMLNGSDLCSELGCIGALERLFPESENTSPVSLVRFACHFHELPTVLPAAEWLVSRGHRVGVNLMQIADRSLDELRELTRMVSDWPVEMLYFADSMGSMTPDVVACIVSVLREGWQGQIGIHTHDNMGLALANTLRAHREGVTWLDSTVTGMGRGPGNARTEELVIEAAQLRGQRPNLVPLMAIISRFFGPMKAKCGWGSNPYYYLSGKYGIHPSYIQEMVADTRFEEVDILAVIEYLKEEGGKKFSSNTLAGARNFYRGDARGTWKPAEVLAGSEVLILGSGPGVAAHRPALEAFARRVKPVCIALNTQSSIDPSLIALRIACHPVRLLADVDAHLDLPQPLITPASMLPDRLRDRLSKKNLLDFGLVINADCFEFHDTYCLAPTSLVLAYALAVAASGHARHIYMAGFDGYPAGDPRNDEVEKMLSLFAASGWEEAPVSLTPTRYKGLSSRSVYAL